MIPTHHKALFEDTLLKGEYNLLFGSGVSLDSSNSAGEILKCSDDLRKDLCKLTGAPTSTSLTRAYSLLERNQIDACITSKYSGCAAGPTLQHIPKYLWRRVFTFNIDDCVENLYNSVEYNKQTLIPLNYDSPFEPTPVKEELQCIHLHGWVGRADAGYVFSANEYVRVMSNLNPWMHLLSEILSTETFIISGSSLNEIDLEYYLSHRTELTPRRGTGPSLLVTPRPDVVTEADCRRYGLIVVPVDFMTFMEWLRTEYPSPPTLAQLIVPDTEELFNDTASASEKLRFFSDFEIVLSGNTRRSSHPSPFMYGHEPSWQDMNMHIDVGRYDNGCLLEIVKNSLNSSVEGNKIILIKDEAGAGKSTVIKRVAHNIAQQGLPVFFLRSSSKIDSESASACLSNSNAPILLLVDGLADHIEHLVEVLDSPGVTNCIVLAAERTYRNEYIRLNIGGVPLVEHALTLMDQVELTQLINRYNEYGLVAEAAAITRPRQYAIQLLRDPVAVAVCRIINDFRPLNAIVNSLWESANQDHRRLYICSALSQHCFRLGIKYSILQKIAGTDLSISELLSESVPLRLEASEIDRQYIVTINPVLGERVLYHAVQNNQELLLDAFKDVAIGLAPYVNRNAIMRRTPEARLAGRLFDVDKVVKPMLKTVTEDFFMTVQRYWEWNSRYWEQRALLISEVDIERALSYARHAVAIEEHPFPLTTLGKLLIVKMDNSESEAKQYFCEAFEILTRAIEIEALRRRTSVHPYATLFSGVAKYIERGGELDSRQKQMLNSYQGEAAHKFPRDPLILQILNKLNTLNP